MTLYNFFKNYFNKGYSGQGEYNFFKNYFNKGYSGQGEYYRSNTERFKKERERFLSRFVKKVILVFNKINPFNRTNKSTKPPLRFKGWKGKR